MQDAYSSIVCTNSRCSSGPAFPFSVTYDAKLPGFGIFSEVTVFPYAAGFSGTITMHADPVSICHGGFHPAFMTRHSVQRGAKSNN